MWQLRYLIQIYMPLQMKETCEQWSTFVVPGRCLHTLCIIAGYGPVSSWTLLLLLAAVVVGVVVVVAVVVVGVVVVVVVVVDVVLS